MTTERNCLFPEGKIVSAFFWLCLSLSTSFLNAFIHNMKGKKIIIIWVRTKKVKIAKTDEKINFVSRFSNNYWLISTSIIKINHYYLISDIQNKNIILLNRSLDPQWRATSWWKKKGSCTSCTTLKDHALVIWNPTVHSFGTSWSLISSSKGCRTVTLPWCPEYSYPDRPALAECELLSCWTSCRK